MQNENITLEKQKICTDCKNLIPATWQELLCENCLDEKYLEAAIAICNTCWFGSEPCICGDNGRYTENEDDDYDYDEEEESEDFEFVDSPSRCEHLDTYVDSEGFTVCENCGNDEFDDNLDF